MRILDEFDNKHLPGVLFSYNYNFPTGDPSYSYNPSQDTRQDLSYLNYFGVDSSESSFAPPNPRHLHRQSFGQESNHGRSSNEEMASYSSNSPGMEVFIFNPDPPQYSILILVVKNLIYIN